MAPKRKNSDGDDKAPKKGKKGQAKPENERDPEGQPETKEYGGYIMKSGRWKCDTVRDNGQVCRGTSKNGVTNITSHWRKHHLPGSAYNKDQDHSYRWPCVMGCEGLTFGNWHSLLGHLRGHHRITGKSEHLKSKAVEKMKANGWDAPDSDTDTKGKGEEEKEDEEDEEEDNTDCSPPSGPPNRFDPKKDDDNGNDPPALASAIPVV
ncbi:uncharacterized protein F4822DRAFT_443954 [Hypoxylon trugodes]|uniref:uncharacterized protein n=1 Tax=Hypoxylon trugodes TaxID=326681 RepID=UPI002198BFF4|nr:uncharacterized protein F4822DRAFT_443954 [Hypoxylon trugodes]KAI1387138.1 hypothetical protein F4822DRAFT_443954 [Hypoxylon trugodes]